MEVAESIDEAQPVANETREVIGEVQPVANEMRDRVITGTVTSSGISKFIAQLVGADGEKLGNPVVLHCLLYTSNAADE